VRSLESVAVFVKRGGLHDGGRKSTEDYGDAALGPHQGTPGGRSW